jgi:hypothetical protein
MQPSDFGYLKNLSENTIFKMPLDSIQLIPKKASSYTNFMQ